MYTPENPYQIILDVAKSLGVPMRKNGTCTIVANIQTKSDKANSAISADPVAAIAVEDFGRFLTTVMLKAMLPVATSNSKGALILSPVVPQLYRSH